MEGSWERERELCKDINFTVSRMMVGTEWDVEEGGKSYYTKDLSFILITTGSCWEVFGSYSAHSVVPHTTVGQ